MMKSSAEELQRACCRHGPGVLAICLLACAGAAWAQVERIPQHSLDAYGNVRPVFRERRPVGVFQNEVQRQALQGYQMQGRRANRRGGATGFALPAELFAGSRLRGTRYGRSPSDRSAALRSSFARYGGFGQRRGAHQSADIATVFSRRRALVTATSSNAPVRRALWSRGLGTSLPPYAGVAPTIATGAEFAPSSSVTLDQRLWQNTELRHRASREEGWAWFREGSYRRAARAFESAYTLEPMDVESRIAELFCYLSINSTRTTLVLLRELARRDSNLFLDELDIAGRYGNRADARDVRLRAELYEQSGGGVDPAALHAFVLWFLGERNEAIRAAAVIARDHSVTPYADWHDQMDLAQGKLAEEGEGP